MHRVSPARESEFFQILCNRRIPFLLEPEAQPADADAQIARSSSEAPPAAQEQYHLVRADGWQAGRHTLGAYRPVEPLKALVFPPREAVGGAIGASPAEMPERIVIGVKNCDLSALRIHDYVFLQTEPVDPFYAEARRKTMLVACDCTAARDVCFCPAVGEQPYATAGFDLNLSPTSGGLLVEAGSERGSALLREAQSCLEPAEAALLAERDRRREERTARVRAQAAEHGLSAGNDFQKAVQATLEGTLWEEFAKDCVECGACNFVCCTCHCFLLGDGMDAARRPGRVKVWDSCLYRNFARVAGGANPRKHRAARLYNRFDKKFNFFPTVLGRYACDGCGRCVEACTGKIDIREVLQRALHAS